MKIIAKTTPVGKFSANAFGLYDMHGNVWEWCQDTRHQNYKGAPTDNSTWVDNNNYRVLRGGSWMVNSLVCRSAYRHNNIPDFDLDPDSGFRVVCSVAQGAN